MDKIKIDVLALIYSSIISTIALLWNIIDTIYSKSRRLLIVYNVRAYTLYKTKLFGFYTETYAYSCNTTDLIRIEITNKSRNEIFIYEAPIAYKRHFSLFKDSLISIKVKARAIDFNQEYPIRLQTGQRIVLKNNSFNIEDFAEFRIKIKDSFGKNYKSGKLVKNNAC